MSDTLYGLKDDEYMETDPGTVYDRWMDDRFDDDYYPEEGIVIEEWSALPLSHFAPRTDLLLEHVGEWWRDDLHEEALDSISDALADHEVIAAFDAAIALLGSKMTGWLQADKRLATHRITWTAEREPLWDGEPLFRPSLPGPGQIDIFGGEVPA